MKILELCHYSAGICGVWTRVREESKRLTRLGHDVSVFSSNFTKGIDEVAKDKDIIDGIKIKRFKAKKLGGESFMYWDYIDEAVRLEPDVIIAHNYRQLHTTNALRLAKILRKKGKNVKVFLVTHAPFVEGNITRKWYETFIVNIYDFVIGPLTLNKFDKVLTISNWESPYLIRAGLNKNKIVYVPNGIPEQFFTQKKSKEEYKILFLGRISPKKKVETLIVSIPYIKDKKIKIEIVGPKEKEYFNNINKLIENLDLKKRVIISDPIYDLKNKIRKIDSCSIFVLPSRVEGMPQSVTEAMSRGKIVIGSDSIAIRDLIKNDKNGYLFEYDNPKDLARVINKILDSNNNKVRSNAEKSVARFNWKKIIEIENNLITKGF